MLKLKRKAYRGIIIMCVTACFFVRHLCLEVLNGGETMKFFNKNINKVLSVVLVVVSVLVVLQFVCSNGTLNAGETPTESAMARVNPNIRKIVPTTTVSATTVPVETTTAKPKATKATTQPQTKATKATKATTQPVTTTQATVPFATAIPPKEPVDYQSQWDAGYLVAIDNPDKTYECSKVTLTDEDRDTFSGNRNQLFYKRLRAGVLPLLPTTPQKAKMTDFPARTFPAARSFPTIRRFGSCVLPAV